MTDRDEKVTKTELIHSKKGWHFNVYYGYRAWAGMVSTTYKTKKMANEALKKFLENGKIDFYPKR